MHERVCTCVREQERERESERERERERERYHDAGRTEVRDFHHQPSHAQNQGLGTRGKRGGGTERGGGERDPLIYTHKTNVW